jgi:hypothetical protein
MWCERNVIRYGVRVPSLNVLPSRVYRSANNPIALQNNPGTGSTGLGFTDLGFTGFGFTGPQTINQETSMWTEASNGIATLEFGRASEFDSTISQNEPFPGSDLQAPQLPFSLADPPTTLPDQYKLPDGPIFRIETKRFFICTYGTCNKKYSRMQELRRHHRGAHQQSHQFKCRASDCERRIRGFSRRDKRDSHEKNMHNKRNHVFIDAGI